MRLDWQQAQDDFETHYKQLRAYVWRVPDAAEGVGRSGGKINRNVREAPCDFIVTHEGVTFHAEVKTTADKNTFKFSNVRKEQWKACTMITRSGGDYRFLVKHLTTGIWYDIPGAYVLEKKENGAGSIKFDDIQCMKTAILGEMH